MQKKIRWLLIPFIMVITMSVTMLVTATETLPIAKTALQTHNENDVIVAKQLSANEEDIVASGSCGDNVTWTLDSEGLLTISGNGDMLNYTSNSPWADKSIKEVKIEKGVTSIGNYAFDDCKSLASITMSDSVTSIGTSSFSDCESLASITMSDSVTSIGAYAFSRCSSITSITLPEGLKTIENYAFGSCKSLASITMPDSVTSIGNNAFRSCTSLTSITLSDSVTSIGAFAFCGCVSLINITIPEGVTSIGTSAFSDCESLINIILPYGVTSISSSMFSGCKNLASITLPNSVTSIERSAFINCTSLTNITLPEDIASIEDYAFSGCKTLTLHVKNIVALEYAKNHKIAFVCIHDLEERIDKNASCTEDGLKANYCTICEERLAETVITKLGHNYESKVTEEATCEEGGVRTYTCKNDASHTYAEEISKLGHDYVEKVTKEATCEEGGVKTYTCKNDASHTYIEELPELGHDWGKEYIIDKNPTCNEAGSKSIHCERCDVIQANSNVSIDTLPHDYIAISKVKKATVSKDGEVIERCLTCSYTHKRSIPHPNTVELSQTAFTYNGEKQHPTVTIYDTQGNIIKEENYDIKYSSLCINPDKYQVKITFSGKYSGSLKEDFEIVKGTQKIIASDVSLKINESALLNAKRPVGNGKLSYTTSDNKIATVSKSGKIIAKSPGTAYITITAKGTSTYKEATKEIKVTVAPNKPVINTTSETIYINEETTLIITGTTETVKWTSSNDSVASVSSKGIVTGLKAGTTTITATVGSEVVMCIVTVKTRLTINETSITLYGYGDSKEIAIKYIGNGSLNCSTSNSNVATATITKKSSNGDYSLEITGKNPGAAYIEVTNTLNNETYSIKVGVNMSAEDAKDLLKSQLKTYGTRTSDSSGSIYYYYKKTTTISGTALTAEIRYFISSDYLEFRIDSTSPTRNVVMVMDGHNFTNKIQNGQIRVEVIGTETASFSNLHTSLLLWPEDYNKYGEYTFTKEFMNFGYSESYIQSESNTWFHLAMLGWEDLLASNIHGTWINLKSLGFTQMQ